MHIAKKIYFYVAIVSRLFCDLHHIARGVE
jgi:hypothetical protein